MTESRNAYVVLTMNTLAFTICFMCWMMNGVLITYLVDNGVFEWTPSQIGWLIGIPVLTGSLTRLPVGILTDKYGGRIVYGLLMLVSAVFMYLMGEANSYESFLFLGLGFGLSGASFAVGIAYTSVWFPKEKQGTALGIFGAGNVGAAVTSLGAPHLLNWFTENGQNIEGWRMLPKTYAASLVVMAIVFFLFTTTRITPEARTRHSPSGFSRCECCACGDRNVLLPGLRRVCRPGAMADSLLRQRLFDERGDGWLHGPDLQLPSCIIRAVGGWMSDKLGPRPVMQWVLGSCAVCCGLLIIPRMDIESPGSGVMARSAGVVKTVSAGQIVVETARGDVRYAYTEYAEDAEFEKARESGVIILPRSSSWQEPVVQPGDSVGKKQLLAKGVTHIFFQANVWIFTGLVFMVGIAMGIGKAAVYRHIPDYFPNDAGVVGGMVGVLGGLGGFFCPIIFGYLLQGTGLWTTCWMFFFVLSMACLVWMMLVVRRLTKAEAPGLARQIETESFGVMGKG